MEYLQSNIDLVLEADIDTLFITEKTWKPIVFKKPFIIYGGKGIHSKLEELGFKLHIELFDYSFDNEDNRLDLICEQVNKYIDMHPNKLRDIIDFDLVDYNYEKSMDIWR